MVCLEFYRVSVIVQVDVKQATEMWSKNNFCEILYSWLKNCI